MEITFKQLKEKLNFSNIPGWKAQYEMAPPDRRDLVDQGRYNISSPKVAAVLILIYEVDGILKFPVILRNTYNGTHSNQIGFPGGKVEKQDLNLSETAKRECFEEIGAEVDKIEILGEMTELFIPPSNFMVYPFVGLYHGEPIFKPCDHEVRKIIPIDLYSFLTNSNKTDLTLHQKNRLYTVPSFKMDGNQHIWGATAMMISEFHEFVRNSLHL